MRKKSIFLNKVRHQAENWFVTIKLNCLVGIIDGVVVLESITLLVLQEDARHMTCGIRVMIAIGSQVTSMKGGKVLLLCVYLLK